MGEFPPMFLAHNKSRHSFRYGTFCYYLCGKNALLGHRQIFRSGLTHQVMGDFVHPARYLILVGLLFLLPFPKLCSVSFT